MDKGRETAGLLEEDAEDATRYSVGELVISRGFV